MLRKYITKHRFFLLFTGIFLVKFIIFPEFAFANDDVVLSAEDSAKAVEIINGFLIGAASIMGLVTSFITIFIYPGWVNGTLFGLQDYLKEIWILVSNIVYFIFAFIIIVIAFMNIIGKGDGNWELKQAMPRFIIGVLIVPFSWFFVQFLLAISAVLTVGVLTLPYDSFKEDALLSNALSDTEFGNTEICKDVVISFSGDFNGKGSGLGSTTSLAAGGDDVLSEQIRCKGESSEITVEELFSAEGDGLDNTIFGVISVYTYGILEIQNLDTLHSNDLTTVRKIADLVFKLLFDLLFVVIYLLLMIALFLALLVRGIRLWIYAMLSPAFGLLYFFGKSGEGFGESGEKFNIKEFIALALVPVYVAAALSFGLIFILVASQGVKENASENNLDSIEAGGFSLEIIGAHGSAQGDVEKSVIGKLIIELFGVVILWIAVMAALGASKTTKAIVEPIAAFGKSVGDLAAKAPTYAPIIPTGGGPNSAMSVSGLASAGSRLEGFVRGEAQNRGTDFANRTLGQGDDGDYTKLVKQLNTVDSTQRNNGTALKESLAIMGSTLSTPGAERNRMIEEINKKLNLDINLGNERNIQNIGKEIRRAIEDGNINSAHDELSSGTKIATYIDGLDGTVDGIGDNSGSAGASPQTLNLNIDSTSHIDDSGTVNQTLNSVGKAHVVSEVTSQLEDEGNDKATVKNLVEGQIKGSIRDSVKLQEALDEIMEELEKVNGNKFFS